MVHSRRSTLIRALVTYTFLSLFGITMLFPLYWMFATSLKAPEDVFARGSWIPGLQFSVHWENFAEVWQQVRFNRFFLNSLIITIYVTVGQVITSSMSAYAFSRLRWPGRDKVFLAYLATMMIPMAVTMIPVYILMRELGWIDSYKALIVPGVFSAYGTFMLRQFFKTIPGELEEAAEIDGCSRLGIYWHVILPLSIPALATLGLFSFLGAWRAFMWPLIVVNSESMFTLPLGLNAFKGAYGTDIQWNLLMAGSLIMTIPMIVVFVFTQRYLISGIRLGALKG